MNRRTRGLWIARNGGRVPTETYDTDVGDQIHPKTKARTVITTTTVRVPVSEPALPEASWIRWKYSVQ